MTTHELRSWTDFFEPLITGEKMFDVRLNDRKFNVGDTLRIMEFDDKKGRLTGREIVRKVTYILRNDLGSSAIPPLRGLQRNYVVMGLK